jgi:predicted small secreted protein
MQSDRIDWRKPRSDDSWLSWRVPDNMGTSTDAFSTRRTLMNRLIALLLIAGTAALAGCNTMAGDGQDISKGGDAITNSAEKAK